MSQGDSFDVFLSDNAHVKPVVDAVDNRSVDINQSRNDDGASPAGHQKDGEFRYEYDVFISYRTNRIPDGPVAEALQNLLENYSIPSVLKKQIAKPKRFGSRLKVFRDATDLNCSHDLSDALRQKLRQSRYLIVICSPDATDSNYIEGEIEDFRAFHSDDRILALLVKGEPKVAFPKPLQNREPIAADVRAPTTTEILKRLKGRGVPKLKQARFKLLGPILGCDSPDQLVHRHRAYFWQRIRVAAVFLIVLAVCAGMFIADQRERSQNDAEARTIMAAIKGEYSMTADEMRALERLAESDEEVRISFIEQLLSTRESTARFHRRFAYVVHSVVGLDPRVRDRVRKIVYRYGHEPSEHAEINLACAEVGRCLEIEDPTFTNLVFKNYLSAMRHESTDLAEFAGALNSMGDRLSYEQIVEIASVVLERNTPKRAFYTHTVCGALGRLVERLPNRDATTIAEQVLAAMKETDNVQVIRTLAAVLGPLREKCPVQAAIGAEIIVNKLEAAPNRQLASILTSALGPLGESLSADHASIWSRIVIELMSEESQRALLASFTDALCCLGGKLPEKDALRAAAHVRSIILRTNDPAQLSVLVPAMKRLNERTPPAAAEERVKQILVQVGEATDVQAVFRPWRASIGSGTVLSPAKASETVQGIVVLMEADLGNAGEDSLVRAAKINVLGMMLCEVGGKLTNLEVNAVAQRILNVARKTKEYAPLTQLAVMLGNFSGIPSSGARPIAQQLLTMMENAPDTNSFTTIAVALCNFGVHLSDKQARKAAQHIIAVIKEEETKAYHYFSLGPLIIALSRLGPKLPAGFASDVAQYTLVTMTKDPIWLGQLAAPLAHLATRLDEREQVCVLKSLMSMENLSNTGSQNPMFASIRGVILAEIEKFTGQDCAGNVWRAIESLERHGIDVANVPRWPLNPDPNHSVAKRSDGSKRR